MANPRKFSEKIALHTHRQAEETARFEQIMKEVSDATARDEGAAALCSTSVPTSGGVNRGGSSPYRAASRARSQGSGPMRRPHDRKLDTSPYSSSTFLSPPMDGSWRRTHSDSALHQSTMQASASAASATGSAAMALGGTAISYGSEAATAAWMMMMNNSGGGSNGTTMQMDGGPPIAADGSIEYRPKSASCDVPRVPGIHIYPSAHVPGTIQIPIYGNNTGSLPDLTNVNFPSPLHMPLDQDQSSSPYSSSPVNTSPSTLSPTNMSQSGTAGGRISYSQQHSPTSATGNRLSVPVSNRYTTRHHSKTISIDSSNQLVDSNEYVQLLNHGIFSQQHQQQNCPPNNASPTHPGGYRSPQQISPQSSPSLGGRHSAPCSPGAPSPLSTSSEYTNIFGTQQQNAQFHQHFEQLSMLDGPTTNFPPPYCDTNSKGGGGPQQQQQQRPQNHGDNSSVVPPTIGNLELITTMESGGGGANYYGTSPSQLMYHPGGTTPSPTLHNTTPNTPNSIPDIILTDFSSATEDVTQQQNSQQQDFSKTSFTDGDLFSEETLRESLGPLDFDGLQMLADPALNLISDSVEDHFRLDRTT